MFFPFTTSSLSGGISQRAFFFVGHSLVSSLLLTLFSVGPVFAATIHVPADQPTVDAALDIAEPGDEILVAEGIYELDEGFTITTENISLRSEVEHGAVFVLGQHPNQLLMIEADGFEFSGFGAYCPRIFEIERDVLGTVLRDNEFYAVSSLWSSFSDRGQGLSLQNNRFHGFFAMGGVGSCAVLEGNLFIFNGSSLWLDEDVTVIGNRFERNSAFADDGSSGQGAAIRLAGNFPPGSVRILQNEFVFNVTDFSSLEDPGEGGAIYAQNATGVEIVGNFFTRNQSRRGAALFAKDSDLVVRDNIFYANSDSIVYESDPERGVGGAMRLENVSGEISNNTMVGNRAGISGGALSFVGPDVPEFRNNLIVANWSEGATIEAEDTPPPEWTCNDVFANEAAMDFSGWPDPTGIDGNFSADPLFCEPDSMDFSLQEGSPCLPSGSPVGCGLVGAIGVGCPVASVDFPELTRTRHGHLQVFPNPSTDFVEIRSSPEVDDRRSDSGSGARSIDDDPAQLRVFSVDGRVLRQWDLPTGTGDDRGITEWTIEWNLRDANGNRVRPGRYFFAAPGQYGQVLVIR